MSETHESPIKTPRQLITVVVLAFVIPILAIVLLVKYVSSVKGGGAGTDSMSVEAINDRLAPVGRVVVAAPAGPKVLQSGEAVYTLACAACHGTGAAGAPKLGDTAAWAPRLKTGYETLVRHAVEGFKAMPAKGGNPALDPLEVARAVVHLANASGGQLKEPPAQ